VAFHGHGDDPTGERTGYDRPYPADPGELYPAVADGDIAVDIPGRVGLHRVSLALELGFPVLFLVKPCPCVGKVAEGRLERMESPSASQRVLLFFFMPGSRFAHIP